MMNFEFFSNWTRWLRFKIYKAFIRLWSIVAGKLGIRYDPPDSLPRSKEAAHVMVHGDTPAETQTNAVYADTPDRTDRGPDWALKTQTEIDFDTLEDLEAFAEEMTVPTETIERWVAAGILTPVEIRVAERLIKIMREKDRRKIS